METETISSRNVVDLLFREEFNAGICGPSSILPEDSDLASQFVLKSEGAVNKSFVLGWDC
jgi:prenylcysteine oxidase/farnesylcysteine lyase